KLCRLPDRPGAFNTGAVTSANGEHPMAKDVDKLIKIFETLTSYQPVLVRMPPIPTPPSWAIEIGVASPTLTGPPPPWPIGVTITPEMLKVKDWLVQHRNERDTEGYREVHNWLAEQMGLSPDTLEPSRWSNPNPNAGSEPPAAPPSASELRATLAATEAPDAPSFIAKAASVGTLAVVEAADIASFTGLKKRKPGAGNKPKLTKEHTIKLQQALRAKIKSDPTVGKHDAAIAWLQRHVVPKIKIKDGKKLTVGHSTLYHHETNRLLG